MRLKVFNQLNSADRKGKPMLGINFKSGIFRLSKLAVEHTGFKDGDQVNVCQDEENPEDWYLVKVKVDGFPLRSSGESGCLLFNCKKVASEIAESVSYSGKNGKCLISREATMFETKKYWGIITGILNED